MFSFIELIFDFISSLVFVSFVRILLSSCDIRRSCLTFMSLNASEIFSRVGNIDSLFLIHWYNTAVILANLRQ